MDNDFIEWLEDNYDIEARKLSQTELNFYYQEYLTDINEDDMDENNY